MSLDLGSLLPYAFPSFLIMNNHPAVDDLDSINYLVAPYKKSPHLPFPDDNWRGGGDRAEKSWQSLRSGTESSWAPGLADPLRKCGTPQEGGAAG